MSKIEASELDRREIEKFTKHLIYKFVQVVVQSRLGARTATRSKQLGSSDWFNLSLPDRADIRDATRAAFGDQLVSLAQPLCVEIALRTNENEMMTLEYWYLQLTDKTTVPESNFTAPMAVYNYIGLLLKSLMVVTRSTPVYKLSRRQSPDTYRTCYEVRLRRPSMSYDSDSFCRQPIGSVPSPLGAVVAFVVYRTKLTICPKQSSTSDLSSTIKDDHFNTTPPCKISHVKSETDNFGDNTQFGASPGQSILTAPVSADVKSLRQKRPAFGPAVPDAEDKLIDVTEMEPPFASLLQHALGTSPPPDAVIVQNRGGDGADLTSLGSFHHYRKSGSSTESRGSLGTRDDFVLVELKAPFAGQEDELGRFYRDCQMAPTLSMFEQTCSLNDMMTSITDQLVQFEASADEFNEFVTSLQQVDI